MKVFVKRNIIHYNGEEYSKDVFLRTEEECSCIHQIETKIGTNLDESDFDEKHEIINFYLVSKHIEYDVDYDWEENPIYNDYETEDLIPIHYCPICGDKIEIIIEETVDKTEELKPLLDKYHK